MRRRLVWPGRRYGGAEASTLQSFSFEASDLTIVPAACFLLIAPIRVVLLSRQSPKVQSSAIRVAILVRFPLCL